MSSLTVILFFGGWLPFFDFAFYIAVPGVFWFSLKTLFFISLFIWARAAYPR